VVLRGEVLGGHRRSGGQPWRHHARDHQTAGEDQGGRRRADRDDADGGRRQHRSDGDGEHGADQHVGQLVDGCTHARQQVSAVQTHDGLGGRIDEGPVQPSPRGARRPQRGVV
jgi:hypothetical protein